LVRFNLLSPHLPGFSFNLWWAIVTRFLAGLLNGNLGVVKSYLAMITTRHNQARAFGLLGLAWGGGSMLGSSLGGFTARPAVTWPEIFGPGDLFSIFPYLLPNLITALFLTAGLISAIVYLPEPESLITSINPKSTTAHSDSEISETEELTPIWKQPQPLLACGSYIQLGLCFILFEEAIPLWLTSTIPSGGLSFSPPQIGVFLMQIGAWFLFHQVVFYRYIPEKIGLLPTHRLGILLMIPVVLLTPLVNRLAFDPAAMWAGLCAVGFGHALADCCAFASVMVLINNSVLPQQFGEANGIAQMGVALVRAVGPAAGLFLFFQTLPFLLPFLPIFGIVLKFFRWPDVCLEPYERTIVSVQPLVLVLRPSGDAAFIILLLFLPFEGPEHA
jgi:hypothetical protein